MNKVTEDIPQEIREYMTKETKKILCFFNEEDPTISTGILMTAFMAMACNSGMPNEIMKNIFDRAYGEYSIMTKEKNRQ